MAFDKTNIVPLNPSARDAGFGVWAYKTTDASTDIGDSGYFNDISTKLEVGDLIIATILTSGVPTSVRMFSVVSNANGVVDCSDAFGGLSSLTDAS